MSRVANRVAQRYLEASDVKVIEADFVSGQEPKDDDSEFITDVEVTVNVSGMALARLFGKQRRVMEAFLEKLKPESAVNRLANGGRLAEPILRATKPKVNRLLEYYGLEEFDRQVKITGIDFTENTDYWEAKIDARKQSIRFTIELSVLGEWE